MQSHDEIERILLDILSHVDERGCLREGEQSMMEFKRRFQRENKAEYAKIMQAFANNEGGYLLFGIEDESRRIVGMNERDRDRFDSFPRENLTNLLNDRFSPEIVWDIGLIYHSNFAIGYIYTDKSKGKPVICKANCGEVHVGEIWYRYTAATTKIKYPEIRRIIDEEKERINESWKALLQKIATFNSSGVVLIDTASGNLSYEGSDGIRSDETTLLVDASDLLELESKAQAVSESGLSEEGRTPTLKIVANVGTPPYIRKQLAEKLTERGYDTNGHQVGALMWKYGLMGNKKYHSEVSIGKCKNNLYSEEALEFLEGVLRENADNLEGFIKEIKEEFNAHNRQLRQDA